MTINQIVRNTVERLKNEGKVWTPDVYTETFCAEAKKAGFARLQWNRSLQLPF
ncbi:MAG: hypothetical protein Q8M43_05185 [Sulfuricurvum sp.]|uniref:hypothetical protein n=1 Tax=Sulfuricurvum sp. TaxID=2025608 RepID=UPI002735FF4A|nr:hypothetical protein [Sulfuricurvum sp.]MDP3291409.1 hypothetical protein [Sulfuricurvum sp.]